MSYQVLARKWRPKNFPEMVGQVHVLKALINALDNDRLHHAYLFTGTRGVGKTTVARILAKSLNCLEGVSSNPCGVCAACQEIDEGRFVDLIEVDAASKTKVEDTRELLENVQYTPTCGRYKVYLIDEVHMLSTHSFNALLKTLEEPPQHVKFLLATTDPQKLPPTVLSRCLQFNLKCLPVEQIVDHQTNILSKEGVEFEKGALVQIARAAEGSMRDSLSLLDQAIAFGGGRLHESEVQAMLGTISQNHVYDLIGHVFNNNADALLAKIAEISGFTPDYSEILAEMINALHRISLAQVAPNAIDDTLGDKEQVLKFSQQIDAADLQLYYQIALMGRKDLPFAPEQRTGFEMIMLRMLAFRPVSGQQKTAANQITGDSRQQSAPVLQTQQSQVQSKPGGNPAAAVMASLQNQQGAAQAQQAEKKTEHEIEQAQPIELQPTSIQKDAAAQQSIPADIASPDKDINKDVSQVQSAAPAPIPADPLGQDAPVKVDPLESHQKSEQSKSSGISAVLAALKNRGQIGSNKDEQTSSQQAAAVEKKELKPDFRPVEGVETVKPVEEIPSQTLRESSDSKVNNQLEDNSAAEEQIATHDIASEYMQYAQMDDYQPAGPVSGDIDLADCGIDVASEQSQLQVKPEPYAKPLVKPKLQEQTATQVMVQQTELQDAQIESANDQPVQQLNQQTIAQTSNVSPATSRWGDIISQLNVSGIVSQLARNCTLIKQTKDELVLKLEETFANLLNATNQEKLSVAINQHFGVPVRLQIDLGVNEQDTPAMQQRKEEICRQQQAEHMIANDPVVKSIQAVFGAEIQAGSVQPV